MRACREKKREVELPAKVEQVVCAEDGADGCVNDCLEIAEEYLRIGSSVIKVFLDTPNPRICLSEDMNHAIVSLKIAKGLYQENGRRDKADIVQSLLESVAEKFLSIGRKCIESQLNNPTQANPALLKITQKGVAALTYAAEVYEIIGSYQDAIFAWSMIKATPSDEDVQQNAEARRMKCQVKLPENTKKSTGPSVRFFPYPPSSQAASSSPACAPTTRM